MHTTETTVEMFGHKKKIKKKRINFTTQNQYTIKYTYKRNV